MRNRYNIYPKGEGVLDRHDNPDYTPPHYPDWDNKTWATIWKEHERALELLELEGLWKQRYEEEARIAKDDMMSGLLRAMKSLAKSKKEEFEKQKNALKHEMRLHLLRTNDKLENKTILDGFYHYAGAFTNEELYFTLAYNRSKYSEVTSKVNRKFYKEVISMIEIELSQRNLPYSDLKEIYAGFKEMTEEQRDRFISTVS